MGSVGRKKSGLRVNVCTWAGKGWLLGKSVVNGEDRRGEGCHVPAWGLGDHKSMERAGGTRISFHAGGVWLNCQAARSEGTLLVRGNCQQDTAMLASGPCVCMCCGMHIGNGSDAVQLVPDIN
jgi:hypothetical protein